MNSAAPAVFLSYASQDAEAARRLCEALRAAGIEVWFDQNELVGGDAWDAKIRGQIAACALFVPLISAATQARLEGYFRLEWRLAEQRSHLMAKGRPFLLPVLIDSTPEPQAHVPDAFREVQWTRFDKPGAEERFATRVRVVLDGLGALPLATPAHVPSVASAPAPQALPAPAPRRAFRRFALPLAALLLLGGAGMGTRFLLPRPAAATDAPPASAQRVEDSPELRRAAALFDLNTVDTSRADFDLAEQILDRELARDSTHPSAVTLYAWLQNAYILRGFDSTEPRLAKARRYSELAQQLSPDDPEAIAAVGFYLFNTYSDLARAQQLLRRAIELNPRDPKYHRLLGWTLTHYNMLDPAQSRAERLELRVEFMAEAAAAFPKDPLVRYDLAMVSFFAEDYPRALAELDAALALQPISTALRDRAWMALWWEGRPNDMTLWLDRTPERFRGEDLAIIARYVEASVTGRFEPALSLLRGLPSPWLSDHGEVPRNLLLGDLLLQQGKPALARVQFETALADLARARAEKPSEIRLRQFEAWTLLRLGRHAEARALLALLLEAEIHLVSPQSGLFWFGTFQLSLLLDDLPSALRSLRSQATTPNRRQLLRNLLRFDPRLAAWREHPELRAILAEPAPAAAAPAAPAASVAVLAFANLSNDPDNEYFSDGVSEELLNVLAKIPGLKVTARTSAFHFKGKDTPIPEIARKLGVAHVVEGSVRKSGSRVRITAQLIRAADGFHLWSETYDRQLSDIFAVQDEIAGLVARVLELKLAGPVSSRPGGTANLEAYQIFLEGKHELNRKTSASVLRSIDHFERATALAPDYALAWAHLAFALNWSVSFGTLPLAEANPRALSASARAVALAPDLPEAHAAAGDAALTAGHWRDAIAASERALALAPRHPDILQSASWRMLVTGELDRSARSAALSLESDPYNVGAHTTLGMAHLFAGRPAAAEETARRLVELAPDSELGRMLQWNTRIRLGRWEDALAVPPPPPMDLWAECYVRAGQGRRAESDALLARLVAAADPAIDDYAFALLHAIRGENDEAFARLERARKRGAGMLLIVRHDPRLAGLRSDPRWQPFLRAMGLADDQLR